MPRRRRVRPSAADRELVALIAQLPRSARALVRRMVLAILQAQRGA